MSKAEITAYLAGSNFAATHHVTLADFADTAIRVGMEMGPDELAAAVRLGDDDFDVWVGRGILDYLAEHDR